MRIQKSERVLEDIPIRVKNEIINHFFLFPPPQNEEEEFDDGEYLISIWKEYIKDATFFFGRYKKDPTRKIFPFFCSIRTTGLSLVESKVPLKHLYHIALYTNRPGSFSKEKIQRFTKLKSIEKPILSFGDFRSLSNCVRINGYYVPEIHEQIFSVFNNLQAIESLNLSFFSPWNSDRSRYRIFLDVLETEKLEPKELDCANLKTLMLYGLYSPNIFLSPRIQKSLVTLKLTYVWHQKLFYLLERNFTSLRNLSLEEYDRGGNAVPPSKLTDVTPLFRIKSLHNLHVFHCPAEFVERMRYIVLDESVTPSIQNLTISYRITSQPTLFGLAPDAQSKTYSYEEVKLCLRRIFSYLVKNEDFENVNIQLDPIHFVVESDFCSPRDFEIWTNFCDAELFAKCLELYDRRITGFNIETCPFDENTLQLLRNEKNEIRRLSFGRCHIRRSHLTQLLESENVSNCLESIALENCMFNNPKSSEENDNEMIKEVEVFNEKLSRLKSFYYSENLWFQAKDSSWGSIKNDLWKTLRVLPNEYDGEYVISIKSSDGSGIFVNQTEISFERRIPKQLLESICGDFMWMFENTLKSVFITHSDIDESHLSLLFRIKKLEYLNFCHCKITCPHAFSEVFNLFPDLVRCYVTQCTIDDEEEVFGDRIDLSSPTLENLKVLNISGFENVPVRFYQKLKKRREDGYLKSLEWVSCSQNDENLKKKISKMMEDVGIKSQFFRKIIKNI